MLQNTVIKQLLDGLVFWGFFVIFFLVGFFSPLYSLRESFSLRQMLPLVSSKNQGLKKLFKTQILPDFPHLHGKWAYLG